MADTTGGGRPGGADADRIEQLAKKLLRGGEENGLAAGDMESARRAARRILEDSEARTFDPATTDPENDEVIRRTSGDTASSGDSTSRRTSSGD